MELNVRTYSVILRLFRRAMQANENPSTRYRARQ